MKLVRCKCGAYVVQVDGMKRTVCIKCVNKER